MGNFEDLVRKFIISLLFIMGIFNTSGSKSATFTHELNYSTTNAGESGQLVGTVTIEATQDPGTDFSFGSTIDRNFIVDVTYTYTNGSGTEFTISNSDISGFTFIHDNPGSTNYSLTSEDGLFDQLTSLHFFGDNGSLAIGGNFGNSGLFTMNADDGSGTTDDFILDGSTYISPGPLPLLGLLPVYGTIKKLKKRFKLSKAN